MNIQQALNRLMKIRQWTDLTNIEQSLFYELVAIRSRQQWKKKFTQRTTYLCQDLGISQRTLIKARKTLINAGLITFTPATRRKQPDTYILVEGTPTPPVTKEVPEEEKKVEKEEENKEENEAENKTHTNINNNNSIKKKENKKKESERDLEEKKEEKEIDNPLEAEQTLFDEFRRAYPGSKRGLETEFENFRKQHKNYREVLPRLLPAIREQIRWVNTQHAIGAFAPQYPHLKTWINNRRWEDEPPKTNYCY